MKLPKGLHNAAKIRMDYNENHDEQGRFAVSSAGSSSALVEGGSHHTKEAASAHAQKNSTKHNGLHTVYDNHAKTYVASFRAGKEVPLKNVSKTGERMSAHGVKAATREGAAKAGEAVRELQAKTAEKGMTDAQWAAYQKSGATAMNAAMKGSGFTFSPVEGKTVSTSAVGSYTKTQGGVYRKVDDNPFPFEATHYNGQTSNHLTEKDARAALGRSNKEAAERGRAAGPGVAMRAEAGDKDAQAAMKEYHANAAAENKMMAKAFATKGLETNKVKSLGISTLKSGPRSASARHLAPKGEPTRAEREAIYAKRADIERHTNNFNEMKQNHTGGGTLKAYLAKHMKS